MPHRTARAGAHVLIVAPFGQDATSVDTLLRQNAYQTQVHGSLTDVAAVLEDHVGAVLLTEEALAGGLGELDAALQSQPSWSGVPFVLLTAHQTGRRSTPETARLRLPHSAINVIVLERPLGAASLLSAVSTALRARQKQFDMRDRLIELEQSRQALQASEAELRRSAERLEQMVEARTADLQAEMASRMRAEEALRQSQKMEAVGQLTGGVAHDFNNLLTIIRSSVDFLRRSDLPEARRLRYVDAISDTTDRAAKLTGQLLAFARRQPLKPEIFDVCAQVASVAELVRPLVGARIIIETALASDDLTSCYVQADISQFETALVNLAVNARDAMDGEGQLTFRVDHVDEVPPVRGHAGAEGDFIAVSVIDTGEGIAEDRLEAIFEPFYTTKEVGKGTGLGLSQVFGFVKQSGGEIEVRSAPGQGATFTLFLPQAARDAQAKPLDLSAGVGPSLRPICVLVVEDNQSVGQFATEMLKDLGHGTVWVGSADKALALLAQEQDKFDVVFSDVVMPGMNGVELARTIRERYPDLPVILTSGYSNVLAQEGRHGFELLQKPYSVEALARVLAATARRPAPLGRRRD